MKNLLISNLNEKDVDHFTSDIGLMLRKKFDGPFKKACNIFTGVNIIDIRNRDFSTDDEYFSYLASHNDRIPISEYPLKKGKNNIILERYPELDKDVLFEQGYIASRSGHSKGSTVDLTLYDIAACKEVDMGGTFDYFGQRSHPDWCGDPDTGEYVGAIGEGEISEEQFNNRMILRNAMVKHGFRPIDTEWWHFTLEEEPYPDIYFNFPVRHLMKQN